MATIITAVDFADPPRIRSLEPAGPDIRDCNRMAVVWLDLVFNAQDNVGCHLPCDALIAMGEEMAHRGRVLRAAWEEEQQRKDAAEVPPPSPDAALVEAEAIRDRLPTPPEEQTKTCPLCNAQVPFSDGYFATHQSAYLNVVCPASDRTPADVERTAELLRRR